MPTSLKYLYYSDILGFSLLSSPLLLFLSDLIQKSVQYIKIDAHGLAVHGHLLFMACIVQFALGELPQFS